jgi:hypothetical protein
MRFVINETERSRRVSYGTGWSRARHAWRRQAEKNLSKVAVTVAVMFECMRHFEERGGYKGVHRNM